MVIRFIFLIVAGLTSRAAYLQPGTPMGASLDMAAELLPPTDAEASDGAYEDFVLIKWSPVKNASSYKVFRTANPQASSLQEISNGWQRSTWLCDYGALPNTDYYYAVIVSDGQRTSVASVLDRGFVKKTTPVANDTGLSFNENERYGGQYPNALMVAGVAIASNTCSPGETVKLQLDIENIFDKSSLPSSFRFYLSQDEILNWDDTFLTARYLSDIPANAKLQLDQALTLPDNAIPGNYYIIIVNSTAENVMNSQLDLLKINIAQ